MGLRIQPDVWIVVSTLQIPQYKRHLIYGSMIGDLRTTRDNDSSWSRICSECLLIDRQEAMRAVGFSLNIVLKYPCGQENWRDVTSQRFT